MEAPPPYPQMPPMPRSNTKMIWGIVIGVVCLCCLGVGGLLVWGFSKITKAVPLFACGYKIQDLRSAVIHYANAHGGKLPNAATWQTDIQPDIQEILKTIGENKRPFGTIKAGEDFGCTMDGKSTGIAFNSDLSGKLKTDIKDPENTVLLFEVPAASANAHAPYKPEASTAPEVIGLNRGWITAPLEGKVTVAFGNGKVTFDGDTFHSDNGSTRN